MASEQAIPARCDADRYIVGRLGFADRMEVPLLDGMDLSDAIRAIKVFSKAIFPDQPYEIAARHSLVETMRRGGDGMKPLLSSVASRRGERPGAITRFGPVHAFARDLPPIPVREELLGLMRTNVRMPIIPTNGKRTANS